MLTVAAAVAAVAAVAAADRWLVAVAPAAELDACVAVAQTAAVES